MRTNEKMQASATKRRVKGIIRWELLSAVGFAVIVSVALFVGNSPGRVPPPDDGKLRIIVFGAHPDDAELKAGGVAAMWAARGHHVKFVSMTNGNLGHYTMSGGQLARRRKAEVQRAAEKLGIQTEVIDIHDGELMPSLENRKTMVRLIREWQADIVMGHRPNDYNPDHRYVGVLLQDAAFMVTVPYYDLNTEPVEPNPVFLYLWDRFGKPLPFEPDIVVGIDEAFQQKVDALHQMPSQFYETVYGVDAETRAARLAAMPADEAGRRAYAEQRFGDAAVLIADKYRDRLETFYGAEAGAAIRYAEAFEICEYGRQPTEEEIRKLFPFFAKE
jgi:LmbE family N-acetylglucosaminyl deacetylase